MTLNEQHPLSENDLTAYIDGQMEPAATADAAAHIALCADCSAAVAESRRLSAELKQWEIEEAPVWIEKAVLTQVPAQPSPKVVRPGLWNLLTIRREMKWIYATAGIPVVVVVLVILYGPGIGRNGESSYSGYMDIRDVRMTPTFLERLFKSEEAPAAAGRVSESDERRIVKSATTRIDRAEGGARGKAEYSADSLSDMKSSDSGFDDAANESRFSVTPPMASLTQLQPAIPQVPGTAGSRRPEAPTAPSVASMIIRSAKLTLVAKDAPAFDNARTQIETVVRDANGYVDELNVSGKKGEGRTLSAKLRLPSVRFDDGLKSLRTLGQLQNESQASDDVTRQFADLTARLVNSRNTEQRLLAIVRERTGKISEVLEAEREVARVREEIERMEAERRNMSQLVAYSTVRVELSEEYHAKIEEKTLPSSGTLLRNASVGGYELARDTILGVLIFILHFGPTLLLVAVAFVPFIFFVWRQARKVAKTS